MEILSLYLVLTNVIIWVLLYVYGNENINLFSILALLIAAIIPYFVIQKQEEIKHKLVEPKKKTLLQSLAYYTDHDLGKKNNRYLIILILVLNVALAILNSYIVMDKIYADNNQNIESVLKIVKVLNITSIIITQFGGFCIQGILIFMLAVVCGSDKSLNSYLKIVGFSYIGFLLLTICSIFINIEFVPANIPLSEFQNNF